MICASIAKTIVKQPMPAARRGAIASAVRDDETGWLVPSGDVAALANRIEALSHDAERVAAFQHPPDPPWIFRTYA
ncbi:MAG TPA: hypothetical protein PLO33_10295, partial [Kouleothrix sp.]|nr:hypothetical protein [Kouleothrix sp.]